MTDDDLTGDDLTGDLTGDLSDDELLAELAAALAATRDVSATVAARARESFGWRTIDEDLLLAELTFDSAHETVGSTRAAAAARRLEFSSSLQSVEIELLGDRMVGQFLPPAAGTVTVEQEDGAIFGSTVDEFGFFTIDPAPQGLVRFRCVTAGASIISDWVRV